MLKSVDITLGMEQYHQNDILGWGVPLPFALKRFYNDRIRSYWVDVFDGQDAEVFFASTNYL